MAIARRSLLWHDANSDVGSSPTESDSPVAQDGDDPLPRRSPSAKARVLKSPISARIIGALDGNPTERLAAVWPETSWRVHAFLRSRGLSESAAEDILQEIAVRALRTGVTYTCADDLVPWACTVGWRFHLGQLRKTTRECSPDRGDRPSTVDVEEEVISRAQMTHVIRAMSTLVESDRRALLETVVDETVTVVSPREAGRRAVARHRARARLLRAMQG